ncbi:hypothetical protein FHP29_07040 [Nocardioides albidus]|uniref:Uncharacterized protein n=1 Tax=Nocardioides albidus TaxID=1517589 RepID=A0A5C4W3B0_9ACTN|nr:hypothetical protein [Nocardioides albidus]TNM42757.1 hypothetical protein FHP29_07040 [Nocardioides albidus]
MLTVRHAPRSRVRIPAALVSLESVTALALAHAAAGGEVPGPWWLAAFAGLVYAAGGLVLRERASIRVVLPALLAVQVLGHAWLVALAPGVHASHAHADPGVLGLTPAMLGAHVVAAAITGAMWSLRRRAVEALVQWSAPGVVPPPAVRRATTATTSPVRTPREERSPAPTRGPPTRFLAIA